ncbi:MAG: rhodanese-like domain-containing protein [Gemmatimonadota bacterium]
MARQLRKAGWPNARALLGGWKAWLAERQPVDAAENASAAE